jgi:hypothetical protein
MCVSETAARFIFFDSAGLAPNQGEQVVVETAKGP